MADPESVRRIVLSLPEITDGSNAARLAFDAAGKGVVWTFMERVEPKKPRVPRLDILAVRCPVARKEMLIEGAPDRFFDDTHYRGYPAILVRLAAIDEDELEALIRAAWREAVPKTVAKRYEV